MNNGDSDQLLKIYDYYVLHSTYCKKIGYRLIKCVTQGKAGFALMWTRYGRGRARQTARGETAPAIKRRVSGHEAANMQRT